MPTRRFPPPSTVDEQPVLQRGHVEKCKAWRTRGVTDFPAVRHVLGIERWCSQRTCLRRPPTASAENKSDIWSAYEWRAVLHQLFAEWRALRHGAISHPPLR